MSEVPERIWYNGTTLHARELRWRPPETDAHPQIEYIRADLALPAVHPHVNETPKSEHEARDVLTPATKGSE